jgi:hypothetical protein
MRGTIALAGILAALSLGCSRMAIDVQRLRERSPASSADACEVRLYREGTRLGAECERVGRMQIRDTGFSTRRHGDRIRSEVEKAACELGGNSAVLDRRAAPMMTCAQADADLYHCPEPGAGD